MATYSAGLETGLAQLITNAKQILDSCNNMRKSLEGTLATGTHWRDYSGKIPALFENINATERGALWLIEDADVIRRLNDSFKEGG